MPKGAIRVIVIVYGVLMGLTYFAGHPPGWMDAIRISMERGAAGSVFGHRVAIRLVVEPPAVPVLPRVVRAIDLRTGADTADLVCAPVPTSLHRTGGP